MTKNNFYINILITNAIKTKYVFIKLIATCINRFHAQNEHCVELALLTYEFIKVLDL